jgi:hypothetical protein
MDLVKRCGIIACGRPVGRPSAITCNQASHKAFFDAWVRRFGREGYHTVHAKFIRSNARVPSAEEAPIAHLAPIELPNVDGVPGNEVIHNFRAKKIHCVQTFQWTCGIPIAWGKCYSAESLPQVFKMMENIWDSAVTTDERPSFMFYDDACNLLRHLTESHPESTWLHSTRFIVDAFHYITHRATDEVCRLWCNPSPADGSQPDLLHIQENDEGEPVLVRAFNSEAAEQLNSWLTGFEGQLRQMSHITFDFFIECLFLIYKEEKEKKIRQDGKDLLDSDVF